MDTAEKSGSCTAEIESRHEYAQPVGFVKGAGRGAVIF
jgi:hypothetical protein